ncbi:hypothetical protein HMPREF9318_01878 [Streptococcus urinalis FB127-CNA-2]|uniref:Cell surface protein n=1 Tax=Streptococcus urinalis 2285-97 TaxID=764291 RepID=G5KDF7_9STRE|nr:hypothetical protein [Streptococcus urinalis]EHJ55939.1 hypothetical protein STRUR_1906 [Streptococcus urinalis 2285-97]EKS17429.1 hypothetical protein HMPREF9318_01878 [Streptococcus urinalis FB127-CNA-2]VEF32749.1 membrane protein [Streptococcus urinalis]
MLRKPKRAILLLGLLMSVFLPMNSVYGIEATDENTLQSSQEDAVDTVMISAQQRNRQSGPIIEASVHLPKSVEKRTTAQLFLKNETGSVVGSLRYDIPSGQSYFNGWFDMKHLPNSQYTVSVLIRDNQKEYKGQSSAVRYDHSENHIENKDKEIHQEKTTQKLNDSSKQEQNDIKVNSSDSIVVPNPKIKKSQKNDKTDKKIKDDNSVEKKMTSPLVEENQKTLQDMNEVSVSSKQKNHLLKKIILSIIAIVLLGFAGAILLSLKPKRK